MGNYNIPKFYSITYCRILHLKLDKLEVVKESGTSNFYETLIVKIPPMRVHNRLYAVHRYHKSSIKSPLSYKPRLRVVPYFSSGIVERACRLFSRGVIFTHACVSLTLLSLRKNRGLLVVYYKPPSSN